MPEIDPHILNQILGELPKELAELIDLSAAPIYPCMAVLPMGFSWAFHLAHKAHVHIASSALPHVNLMQDRTPIPKLGAKGESNTTAMLIYADNNNHVGTDLDKVAADQDAVMGALHQRGLDTHDVTEAASLAESLGVRIDGMAGHVLPTPKRDWRLDRALSAICRGVKLSGQELQVVIGHVTVRSLLHRGLMGIIRYAYAFIEKNYTRRTRVWGSVLQELYHFRHLMVLGFGNFKQAWSDTIFCTDACLSGYAVMSSVQGSDTARTLGRHDERWRFRLGSGKHLAPRRQALDTSMVFEDPLTVKPEVDGEVMGHVEVDPRFPDVEPSVMSQEKWRRVWCCPVHHREPVHLIEARSILGAVKHIARDSRRHGQRFVILNDNMSVVLALQKGRCSSFSLLRLIRRISAHVLVSNIRLCARWVPSEWNVADQDSRRWEPKVGVRKNENSHRNLFESALLRDFSATHGIQTSSEEEGGGLHPRRGEGCKPPHAVVRSAPREGRAAEREKFVTSEIGEAEPGGPEEPLGKPQEAAAKGHPAQEEVRGSFAGDQGGAWTPGAEQRARAAKEGLLEQVGGLLQLRRPVRPRSVQRKGAGRSLVRLRGHPVPRRLRQQLRREADGGGRVRAPRVRQEPWLGFAGV